MKKSFFGDYILYKLRGKRSMMIASAVMNFLSTTLIGALATYYINIMKKYLVLEDSPSKELLGMQGPIVIIGALIAAGASIAALTIIIMFTPASTFEFFVKKNLTDTLGCLPLTYRQRFWGDFLGGLGVHMISFIPCSALGLILSAAANGGMSDAVKKYVDDSILRNSADNIFVKWYLSYILLLFVGYMGAYAVSCFVTVCCGRSFNAKACSLISHILPAGLVSVYCSCAFSVVVGIDHTTAWMRAIAAIPPVGTWFSAIYMGSYGFTMFNYMDERLDKAFFILREPAYFIIIAVLLAVLIFGAYFLGKLRKNERTGREFVFGGAYYVLSVMTVVFIIGIVPMVRDEMPWLFSRWSICAILVALVIYVVIELIHERSFKWIWMTVLRFVAMCLVCQGFFMVAYYSRGFGVEEYLPPRAFVSEVRVSGNNFFNDVHDGSYIYRSDEAISTILSEHEKLLGERNEYGEMEGIFTGDDISITYVLKNGREVVRSYRTPHNSATFEPMSKTLIEVCDAIHRLTPTDSSALGFIDDPQYDSISITYYKLNPDETFAYVRYPAVYITKSREDEFMELLRYDTINNLSRMQRKVGEIIISYTTNGRPDWDTYYIYDGYTSTLEFLNDPANITEEPPEKKEIIYTFSFSWGYWDMDGEDASYGEGENISDMMVFVSSADESAEAKELIGYLRNISDIPAGEVSKNLAIYSNSSDGDLSVTTEDEQAVIRAMLKFIRIHME